MQEYFFTISWNLLIWCSNEYLLLTNLEQCGQANLYFTTGLSTVDNFRWSSWFFFKWFKGNLLRGIDNCLGAALSVLQVRYKALDSSFSKNSSSKAKSRFIKTLCNYEIINKLFHSKCNFKPFYFLVNYVLLRIESFNDFVVKTLK